MEGGSKGEEIHVNVVEFRTTYKDGTWTWFNQRRWTIWHFSSHKSQIFSTAANFTSILIPAQLSSVFSNLGSTFAEL